MSLAIPSPKFDSELTDLIVDLERLRHERIGGTTPVWIFFELKNLFHIIESIASSRIEGNHTTIAEYVDAEISGKKPDESIQEIKNVNAGITFIEAHLGANPIDKDFILELHKIIVHDLKKEGDARTGGWRIEPRRITRSSHVPPQPADISDLMKELIEFINRDVEPKKDLLKAAIAHHRFAWIHPFGNGNGRTVRLLTYAMLTKQGFIDQKGFRLLNPTAVFCSNRQKYYDMLELADSGDEDKLLRWCEYVLTGIKIEIEKIHRLTEAGFTKTKIIRPALRWARDHQILTEQEEAILSTILDKDTVKADDLRTHFPEGTSHVLLSRHIRRLIERDLIAPIQPKKRRYRLKLSSNQLTRGILEQLDNNGFLPVGVDE